MSGDNPEFHESRDHFHMGGNPSPWVSEDGEVQGTVCLAQGGALVYVDGIEGHWHINFESAMEAIAEGVKNPSPLGFADTKAGFGDQR